MDIPASPSLGNPNAWRETILQIEDLGPEGEHDFVPVGKFHGILGKVAERVTLDPEARFTFEVGPPGAPMQVFDADALLIEREQVTLRLGARPALCKPRHRAVQTVENSCCGPKAQTSSCCS